MEVSRISTPVNASLQRILFRQVVCRAQVERGRVRNRPFETAELHFASSRSDFETDSLGMAVAVVPRTNGDEIT